MSLSDRKTYYVYPIPMFTHLIFINELSFMYTNPMPSLIWTVS